MGSYVFEFSKACSTVCSVLVNSTDHIEAFVQLRRTHNRSRCKKHGAGVRARPRRLIPLPPDAPDRVGRPLGRGKTSRGYSGELTTIGAPVRDASDHFEPKTGITAYLNILISR